MIAMLIFAQAATPIVTITPPRPFDLATVKPRNACNDIDFAAVETDVLVCATRPRTPPLPPADQFASAPLKPEVDVLGGTLDVAAEQRSMLMGSAPAAMVRFKLKF